MKLGYIILKMWRHICHDHVLVFVVIHLLALYGGKIEMHNAQKHSSATH